MAKLSIKYFRDVLAEEVKKLESFCTIWEKICSEPTVPEEASDEIRTSVGLAKLLIAQKLKQFSGLIDDSEFKRAEKDISCVDLQGFWDMVYQEVEKIGKRFENLEKWQKNNWEKERSPIKEKTKKITVPKVIKPSAKSNPSTKAHILAARRRLAEAKNNLKSTEPSQEEFLLIKANSPKNKRSAKESSQKAEKNKENVQNVDIVESPKKKLAVDVNKKAGNKPVKSPRKKKGKETMPLQCVTRAAARALLMNQK